MLVVIVKGDGVRELFALCLWQDLVVPNLVPRMLFAVRVSERGGHLLNAIPQKNFVGGSDNEIEALLPNNIGQRFVVDASVVVDEFFAHVIRIRKGHAESFDGWALF